MRQKKTTRGTTGRTQASVKHGGQTLRPGPDGSRWIIPPVMPILPVRNMVVFPGSVVPLNVGRPKSKNLLDTLASGDKLIAVVHQTSATSDDPQITELDKIGTVCAVLKVFRLPDGNQSIIVHGLCRISLGTATQTDPYLTARIKVLDDIIQPSVELDALMASTRQQARRVAELSPNTPDETAQSLDTLQSPGALADFLAANLQIDAAQKQQLLAELKVTERLRVIAGRLASQLDVLELQQKIQADVKESIDKSQRRYFLTEQLKAIRRELGESDPTASAEATEIRTRLEQAAPPVAVMKEASRELSRLESTPPASPEYGVIRTYLQILCELPWNKLSEDNLDLAHAGHILDRDHHGLSLVKRRIIEFLAVRKLKALKTKAASAKPGALLDQSSRGAVLCFVGPPGVGKTSLGRSIAAALGRQFIRISLGGVRDEADIRGHRRTYIGSMPGRIISELRKCGTRNPVIVLDEVDKLGSDLRGDPSAALLEVLDPAQNHAFIDHYLDAPFNLSDVLFITTANSLDAMTGPLRDRLEVLEISGYTLAEKLLISRQHLVPRQLNANGLTARDATFSAPILSLLVEGYTREAGVRGLERSIGSVCRSIAADIVGGNAKQRPVKVTPQRVRAALGHHRFEAELADRKPVPGVATGLAYTPMGGEILFVEAARYTGKGRITLTGQIGSVMKESATAAFSIVRSRASEWGIDPILLSESDIHIHVPAGAVPKDGPSAGVAMLAAIVSLLTGRTIPPSTALTGEITLRGQVLPVGGLKEKLLAARRAGINRVLLPARNLLDIEDLPTESLIGLELVPVATIDELLAAALMDDSAKRQPSKKRGKKDR